MNRGPAALALATAARELVAAGLVAESRPLLDRLVQELEAAQADDGARIISIDAARTKKRDT